MAEDLDEIARLRADLDRLRAENRRLSEKTTADRGRTRPHRGRIALSIVLTIVATLLVPPTIAGVWLDRNLTDTDRYVETVAPLVRDPAVKAALTQTTLTVPIANGALMLGTWQGIYLFEHRTAPHTRQIVLHAIGE